MASRASISLASALTQIPETAESLRQFGTQPAPIVIQHFRDVHGNRHMQANLFFVTSDK